MTRRAVFGISLLFLAASAVGAVFAWLSDAETAGWVLAGAIAGTLFLAAGLSLATREILRGVWKLARVQSKDDARLKATQDLLGALRKEQAAVESKLMGEFVLLNQHMRDLEQRLTRTQATMDEQVLRLTDAVNALTEVKKSTTSLSRDVGAIQAGNESERRRTRERWDKTRQALGQINDQYAEKVNPALRNLAKDAMSSYRQIEAMVSLTASLDLAVPLPPMRATWAMSPDSAALLVRLVFEHRPQVVLEIGSGVSTVLVARAMELTGGRRFRSLDHESRYLGQTRELLRSHGLEERVELVEAELTGVEIAGDEWTWYSPTGLEGLDSVDLVIIDGPPSRTGPQARYPAIPLLANVMNDGALVFLDDAEREDEQATVQRWISEFPLAAMDVPKLEKGAAVLEWHRDQ